MKPYWERQEAIEKLETEVEELRDKIGWRKMKAILEFNLPEDELTNVLIGLSELHDIRCKKLFNVFESMVKNKCFKKDTDEN